jgi:chromosome segregation ATPase
MTQEKLQSMRQRYSEVADRLKQELSSLEESYRQLGQRASTLASERDTLHASLDEARQSSDLHKTELETLRDQHYQFVNDLQSRLAAEEEIQRSLRDEIADLTRLCEERAEAFAPLENQISNLQSSMQKSLLREKKALNERNTVAHKMEDAEAKSNAAEKERQLLAEQLFKVQEEAENTHSGYLGKIAVLEERVTYVESERDEARQRIAELEAALYEHTSHQVEELENALEQARSAVNEFEFATASEPETGYENSDTGDQNTEDSIRAESASA